MTLVICSLCFHSSVLFSCFVVSTCSRKNRFHTQHTDLSIFIGSHRQTADTNSHGWSRPNIVIVAITLYCCIAFFVLLFLLLFLYLLLLSVVCRHRLLLCRRPSSVVIHLSLLVAITSYCCFVCFALFCVVLRCFTSCRIVSNCFNVVVVVHVVVVSYHLIFCDAQPFPSMLVEYRVLNLNLAFLVEELDHHHHISVILVLINSHPLFVGFFNILTKLETAPRMQ